jgi:hypothetical protein
LFIRHSKFVEELAYAVSEAIRPGGRMTIRDLYDWSLCLQQVEYGFAAVFISYLREYIFGGKRSCA